MNSNNSDSTRELELHDNVDPAEIAKFENLASRWWDPEGEFKPLHQMNPIRTEFITDRSPVDGKQVLDVGCGGGILAESLSHKGGQVTAIDMGEAPLAVARLHALESGQSIDYRHTTAEALSETHCEQFDVITCLEMLEHVPDPRQIIQACEQMATPGADLYFSTINRNPKSFLFAVVGAEYVLNLLPRGTHEYRKFIKPSELAADIRQAGLEVLEITGLLYNPLTEKFKLNPRDLDVNYMVHARKPVSSDA